MLEKNDAGVVDKVEPLIFIVRGNKVILDTDLAKLYGVSTKALNQSVKRNQKRFPLDFAFKLTKEEKQELVTNCDRLTKLKHSTSLPNVFTEHGAIMAASILSSQTAIEASIFVVRAFVNLRETLLCHKALFSKVEELERKIAGQDQSIRSILETIRLLMKTDTGPRRRIGFVSHPDRK